MAKLYLGDTEIAPIIEVPAPEKKYGVDINAVLGDVDANGALSFPTAAQTLDLSSVKSMPRYGLYYKFYQSSIAGDLKIGLIDIPPQGMNSAFSQCTSLTSVDLSSLTTVSGSFGMNRAFEGCTGLTSVDLSSLITVGETYGMYSAFSGCAGLTSVDLSSLTTVSGSNAMYYAFTGCTGLTSIDLSSLTMISGSYAMNSAFSGCTGLTSVDLSSLTTVSGGNAMNSAFEGCTGLTSISFPALKEILPNTTQTQFTNMFLSCTALAEIHFPSNMQERVEQLSGYATKFGRASATILFDLPSTADA